METENWTSQYDHCRVETLQRRFAKWCIAVQHGYTIRLGDQGGSGRRLVLPVRGKLASALVVTSDTVDTALDQNEAELGVLVLAVALQVLAHAHGLLDEVVQVLRDFGGHTGVLQDTEDLGAGHALDLGDTVGVTEDHTDLRRSKTLLGQVADLLLDGIGGGGQPGRRGPLVGEGRGGDTLSVRTNKMRKAL